MPVTGDFDKLRKIAAQIAALGKPSAKQALVRSASRTVQELVRDEFRRGVDPDGRRWEPLKRGRRRPLQGSGRLANSFKAVGEGTGVTLTTEAGTIVQAHQEGATIPPRKVGGAELLFNPKTNRFLGAKRAARRKLVLTGRSRETTAKGFKLPARRIVPVGELSAPWATAFNAVAEKWLAERVNTK